MNDTQRKTSLYPLHLELGARMVPFAGYQMPLSYGKGIIHEHLHTRKHAGFFDISHMGQLRISGRTAAREMENLTPGTITRLQPGYQQYTLLTNDSGGIIDDLIITNLDSELLLIINAACMEKDIKHLQSRLSFQCVIDHLQHHSLFALQGPGSAQIMQKLSATAAGLHFMMACITEIDGIPCTVSRSGYTGEDGFEIAVANTHAIKLANILLSQENVEPVGLGARDTLRLEAGLCLYGHELTESITPVAARLEWVIKNRNGDYPGAELIKEQLLNGVESLRVGIRPDGKIPVRANAEILDSHDKVIGVISSGSYGPSVGHPVAMGYINRQEIDAGHTLFVKIRTNKIPVTIVPLPFVPHRYLRK